LIERSWHVNRIFSIRNTGRDIPATLRRKRRLSSCSSAGGVKAIANLAKMSPSLGNHRTIRRHNSRDPARHSDEMLARMHRIRGSPQHPRHHSRETAGGVFQMLEMRRHHEEPHWDADREERRAKTSLRIRAHPAKYAEHASRARYTLLRGPRHHRRADAIERLSPAKSRTGRRELALSTPPNARIHLPWLEVPWAAWAMNTFWIKTIDRPTGNAPEVMTSIKLQNH